MCELWLLCTVLVFALSGISNGSKIPSAVKSLVWGSGLEPNIVLPARYFFIQAVDNSGQNFTSSPGESTFQVKIVAPGEEFSRIWVQVLDRKDGSFVVRYRMYASYPNLQIDVQLQDKHVAKSPYTLTGPVYHENCECPEDDSAKWLERMHCPQSISQILRDLAFFQTIDPDKIVKEITKRFGQRQSLCHYTIKDNQVYIKTHGEHVGFRIFMDAILLSLTRKVKLPDVEFFVNLGDWPLEKRKPTEKLHPILSWCGSNETRDIVMPTYDLTESVLETMGRVSLDMISVQANTGPVWEDKNSTAFWRGRDSRRERLELVKLARKHPDLIDAAFTNFFFFKHNESLYGPLVKHVSFFDFFKYKYQINIDGTVAAYRLPYLLAGDSVVLKQDSVYYEHFYNDLKPWEHYVPFKRDLSDLLEKIQWVKNHDVEAKKIAKAGQEFARNSLMGDTIFCYYVKLFQEYANLQVGEPKIREGMELVEQPKDDLFPCTCHRKKVKDEL
ncbi:protein O-glucosyltransferase 2-like [Acipenser ruthenus]|uniref:protein O-glucosyltransferase 2-like n=1 Tax=Acipenser ruthenus TaxID=7906 RepID=UPI00145ADBC2|nr:protein O-glucosyltransferase 2-like [Acipenser ruthenus]XP_033864474.3 protein O-glucosyltransferase 2-like [Acipenser ruthenus]XP_033864475.3 protein O-glucosyltransferase 2-like [Acipenser ruthenus]